MCDDAVPNAFRACGRPRVDGGDSDRYRSCLADGFGLALDDDPRACKRVTCRVAGTSRTLHPLSCDGKEEGGVVYGTPLHGAPTKLALPSLFFHAATAKSRTDRTSVSGS